MGLIMIRCPRTGREISTGIRMSRREFERLPVFFARAFCPTCQSEHEWFAKDAWVCDDAQGVTIPRAAAALRADAGAPFDPTDECAGRLLSGGGGRPSGAGTTVMQPRPPENVRPPRSFPAAGKQARAALWHPLNQASPAHR